MFDVIQPIRPFWVRLSLREDLGTNLAWRAAPQWQRDERRPDRDLFYFAAESPTGIPSGINPYARQRLRKLLAESPTGPESADVTRAQARAAAAAIEPQLVLESILSEEWENWGNPRFYQENQRIRSAAPGAPLPQDAPKPNFCIPCHSIGDSDVRQETFDDSDGAAWWYVNERGEGACWIWT